MDREQIKQEFINEVETILSDKSNAINKLSGVEQLNAKHQHLDELDSFAELLNEKLNSLLEKHNVDFNSDAEFNEFIRFIKPTFDQFYMQYAEIGFIPLEKQ